MTDLDDMRHDLAGELGELERESRLYRPPVLTGPQGAVITVDGEEKVCFASNNYLGMANDPDVVRAAHAALDRWGFGLGTGRHICSMGVQEELEQRLAAFKQVESVVVLQTGYDTNLAVLSTLLGEGDVAFSDALNHASIIDGLRATKARVCVYAHRDLDDLERLLAHEPVARRRVIVTDGVFSMDGDIAPLEGIVALAEAHGAYVYVDDAHGEGVLGARGAGIVEHFGLHGRVQIEVGTLSKAFGGMGGFVAADRDTRDYVYQRARPFAFATGHLPPSIAAGLIESISLLEREPERLTRLHENTRRFRERLTALGFDTGSSETPIVPVIVGAAEDAAALKRGLWERGVYAQAFSHPVVPPGKARVRCIVSAAHTAEHLAVALEAFEQVGRERGLI